MLRLDRQVPADVLSAIGSAVDATTLELVDLS
jgi:D-3-phosphoglycerate dehydrogenase